MNIQLRSSRPSLELWTFFLSIVVIYAPAALALPPGVSISGGRVVVTGIRAGGSVALCGAAHERAYYMTRIVTHRTVVTDDDRDGRVEFRPPNAIPFRSIWIVTDIETGETVVATPSGYRAFEMAKTLPGRGNAVDVAANAIEIGRDAADIVVVRPGKGAWGIALRQQGTDSPSERPPVSGRTRASLARLQPLAKAHGQPPAALQQGDVVVVIDPEQMEYAITKLERGAN